MVGSCIENSGTPEAGSQIDSQSCHDAARKEVVSVNCNSTVGHTTSIAFLRLFAGLTNDH